MPATIYLQRREVTALQMKFSEMNELYQYGDTAYKIDMKYECQKSDIREKKMLLFVKNRGPQLLMTILDAYWGIIELFGNDEVRNVALPCFLVSIKRYPLPDAADFRYRVNGEEVNVHPYRLSITTWPTNDNFIAFIGPVQPDATHLNRYRVIAGKQLFTLHMVTCSHRYRPPVVIKVEDAEKQHTCVDAEDASRKREANWGLSKDKELPTKRRITEVCTNEKDSEEEVCVHQTTNDEIISIESQNGNNKETLNFVKNEPGLSGIRGIKQTFQQLFKLSFSSKEKVHSS